MSVFVNMLAVRMIFTRRLSYVTMDWPYSPKKSQHHSLVITLDFHLAQMQTIKFLRIFMTFLEVCGKCWSFLTM